MAAVLNGVKLIEQGDNVLVAQGRRKNGFEPQTIEVWKTLASRGKVMVDAGCYTGFYAILASINGASEVYAYEPNPLAIERIKKNIDINKADNIWLREYALSNTNGSAKLYGKPNLTSAGSLVKSDQEIASIKTRKLDDEVIPKVYAIKIDVERAEINLLKGAINTIMRCRPHILIEALDGTEEIDKILSPIGYEARKLDKGMYYYRVRGK